MLGLFAASTPPVSGTIGEGEMVRVGEAGETLESIIADEVRDAARPTAVVTVDKVEVEV